MYVPKDHGFVIPVKASATIRGLDEVVNEEQQETELVEEHNSFSEYK